MGNFLVCNRCHAGVRQDSRAAFEELGLIDAESRCKCGGQYELVGSEEAIGAGGALDILASPRPSHAEAAAEALAQLEIAQTARGVGDEGSAWAAVAKATRILRSTFLTNDGTN